VNLGNLLNFSWTTDAGAWIGLLSLIALEIVLGIDNIVFITILAGKLPKEQQPQARKIGLILAVVPRILLLLSLGVVLSLERDLFTLPFPDPEHKGKNLGFSGQDLIVILGGLFLLAKATHEIHNKLEGDEHAVAPGEHVVEGGPVAAGGAGTVPHRPVTASYTSVLVQIALLNIVFSLDSIITAIGMIPKEQVLVMIIAVLIATGVMALAVNRVSAFVEKHPTVKMLALSFLLLIGMTLVGEGFGFHIPKGYVYFAMGFSVFVEVLNLRANAKRKAVPPVALREPRY